MDHTQREKLHFSFARHLYSQTQLISEFTGLLPDCRLGVSADTVEEMVRSGSRGVARGSLGARKPFQWLAVWQEVKVAAFPQL